MRGNSIEFSRPHVTFGITHSMDFVHGSLFKIKRHDSGTGSVPDPQDSVMLNPENGDSFISVTSKE
jgi:hypothetical protein